MTLRIPKGVQSFFLQTWCAISVPQQFGVALFLQHRSANQPCRARKPFSEAFGPTRCLNVAASLNSDPDPIRGRPGLREGFAACVVDVFFGKHKRWALADQTVGGSAGVVLRQGCSARLSSSGSQHLTKSTCMGYTLHAALRTQYIH